MLINEISSSIWFILSRTKRFYWNVTADLFYLCFSSGIVILQDSFFTLQRAWMNDLAIENHTPINWPSIAKYLPLTVSIGVRELYGDGIGCLVKVHHVVQGRESHFNTVNSSRFLCHGEDLLILSIRVSKDSWSIIDRLSSICRENIWRDKRLLHEIIKSIGKIAKHNIIVFTKSINFFLLNSFFFFYFQIIRFQIVSMRKSIFFCISYLRGCNFSVALMLLK